MKAGHYIYCDKCEILWSEQEYLGCPLCRLKREKWTNKKLLYEDMTCYQETSTLPSTNLKEDAK
jgi:hypothetical protein